MAIDYNSGISSLDAGASDIKYTGDQGPKSPQDEQIRMAGMMNEIADAFERENGYDMSLANPDVVREFIKKWKEENWYGARVGEGRGDMRMASADPVLQDEYDKYVFDLQENNPGATPMTIEEFRQQAISGMAEGGIARL